ncbi:hypothetical protein [Nocardia cyriacigeorgica]|nr:hypothetical protein [Nocardia cyriacigeorgica]MBF6161487.1 hypothetical protein [Nocardia cyriacigeorgica]MBF6200088.1 hypothetical protein [Nocardia cyriacigeorgica]MBF6346576.1 hypothetical protein [Nocardia cyriacigeorgica]
MPEPASGPEPDPEVVPGPEAGAWVPAEPVSGDGDEQAVTVSTASAQSK